MLTYDVDQEGKGVLLLQLVQIKKCLIQTLTRLCYPQNYLQDYSSERICLEEIIKRYLPPKHLFYV